MGFQIQSIEQLVLDLLEDFCLHLHTGEMSLRKSAASADHNGNWYLDSLVTYQGASYVSQMFDIPVEDESQVLFEKRSLNFWAKVIAEHLQNRRPDIVFYTSGSTGKRKVITHSTMELEKEARCWIELFGRPEKVYMNVPKHHIYGYIWGVLIPMLSDCEVFDYRTKPLHTLSFDDDAMIVTVPHAAQLLFNIEPQQANKIDVVLSTAPCDQDLFINLKKHGFRRVLHIYGSTETGGVGFRLSPDAFFTLRPDLSYRCPQIFNGERDLDIQDELEFLDNEHFKVIKRLDNITQINGYNVSVAEVVKSISGIKGVLGTHVELMGQGASKYLFVYLVKSAETSKDEILGAITQTHEKILNLSHIEFVERLPVDKVK